jgi:diguanylate cyclase (GGDEF)-like protein
VLSVLAGVVVAVPLATALGLLMVSRTGLLRHIRELETMVGSDALTGVANRRLLDRLVGNSVGAGGQQWMAYVDVDHFKRVNDHLGHDAGDTALKAVAGAIKESLRPNDTVFRVGGDEFAVLLEACSAQGVNAVAHRIRGALAGLPDEGVGPLTVSIGVCPITASRHIGSARRVADAAMLEAKRRGGDTVVFAGWVPANPGQPQSAQGAADWQFVTPCQ